MKNFIPIFSTILFLFPSFFLDAQCTIEQTTFNASAPVATEISMTKEIGQTFKACGSGKLLDIMVKIESVMSSPVVMDLKIIEGIDTVGATVTLLHTQSVTVNSSGDLTFTLDTPVNLEDGKSYTFSLIATSMNTSAIRVSSTTGDQYSDGEVLINQNFLPSRNTDLYFRVNIAGPIIDPTTGSATIPTLSQWGLLIFGLLILNISVFKVIQIRKFGI